MAKLKTYSMNLDGTHNVMVAASSQRAAAELIGTTVYMLRTWDAGYNEDDEALALSEPGQVFRQKGVNGAWERWPLTPVGFSEPQPPLVQIPGSASEQPETLFSKLVRFHRTKGYLRDGDEAAVEFHHHSARAIEEMRLAACRT